MSSYQPMKAVLVDGAFSDPAWVFERKLDGIRCGALRVGGRVRLISRSGQPLNATYPELVEALDGDGDDVLIDGEIVAFTGSVTSFERLQRRMMLERLGDELERRETKSPPFREAADLPRRARWADPELVAQVAFTEWTRDGKLRHPHFQGLRTDKAAREVVREVPS